MDMLSQITREDHDEAPVATDSVDGVFARQKVDRRESVISDDLHNDQSDDDMYNAPVRPSASAPPIVHTPEATAGGGIFSSFFRTLSCMVFSNPEITPPPRNWHIQFEEIRQLSWLGAGAHGCVFLGVYRDQMVAVKKLKELEMTQREMKHLQQLDHENIVRLIGVCLQAPVFALVMEYCAESLYDIIHKQEAEIPPRLVLLFASQIARGMQYLHEKGIIHRDLKSPNVLKSGDRIKISDFGTSKERPDRSMKFSFIGTVAWMAPEVIRNEACCDSVDVWSFGVVLWELLTCKIPYQGVDPGAIVWGVGSNSLKLPIPSSAPDGFSLLLQQCWNTTPRNRPAFRQILVHLDILSADSQFGVLSESSYLMNQRSWKVEVEQSFRTMKQESEDDHATNSSALKREEFSHIDDIRIHYEKNLEECRQQRLQLEEMSRMLRLREEELQKKEEQLRLASSPKKLVVKENIQSRAKAIEDMLMEQRRRRISDETDVVDDSGVSKQITLSKQPSDEATGHSRTPSDMSFLIHPLPTVAEHNVDSLSTTDGDNLPDHPSAYDGRGLPVIIKHHASTAPLPFNTPHLTTTPQHQPTPNEESLFAFL